MGMSERKHSDEEVEKWSRHFRQLLEQNAREMGTTAEKSFKEYIFQLGGSGFVPPQPYDPSADSSHPMNGWKG